MWVFYRYQLRKRKWPYSLTLSCLGTLSAHVFCFFVLHQLSFFIYTLVDAYALIKGIQKEVDKQARIVSDYNMYGNVFFAFLFPVIFDVSFFIESQLRVLIAAKRQETGRNATSSELTMNPSQPTRDLILNAQNTFEASELASPPFQPLISHFPSYGGQHVAINASRAPIFIQPTFAQNVPTFDEIGVLVHRVCRPEIPGAYEYRAPADILTQQGTTKRTTTVTTSSHHEEVPGAPFDVQVVRYQRPRGIKKTATFISSINVASHHTESDESSFRFDQLRRVELPQLVAYKVPANIQPSKGTVLKSLSACGLETPAQEASINITQLRQPIIGEISARDLMAQHASSITRLSTATDIPILNETAVQLDQIQRRRIPQTVHYKSLIPIQPSISYTRKTAFALSEEEPCQETSFYTAHFRQPISEQLFVDDGRRYAFKSI